jgi:hypothetical protein
MNQSELSRALCILSDLWAKAEEQLQSVKWKSSVEYEIPNSDDVIAFRKNKDAWRICVAYGDDWKPILECTVAEKIEFVEPFKVLQRMVLDRAEFVVQMVPGAIDSLGKTIALAQRDSRLNFK